MEWHIEQMECHMRRFISMLAVLVLVAAACSSGNDVLDIGAPPQDSQDSQDSENAPSDDESDQSEADAGDGDQDAPVVSTGGGGDFCAIAAELEANDPFEDLSFFDGADFFDAASGLWDQVGASAPPELQGDVATVAAGLDDLQGLLEQYDYDFFNEELGAAMATLDTSEMDAAGESIETYVSDVCGIELNTGSSAGDDGPTTDPGGLEDLVGDLDLENFNPENTADVLAQIFGVDQELAECLAEEFGDFDPENIDSSTLTQEVCGTTLLEVVSGIGG